MPRYPLAVLAKTSTALTTRNPLAPAVAGLLKPATWSVAATSGFTVIPVWLPVMLAVAASVAVMEKVEIELDFFSVTLNACAPLSTAVNVWSTGRVVLGLSEAMWTVPRYAVAVLLNLSSAVTVSVPRVPAITGLGKPVSTSVVATSGIPVAVNVVGDPVSPAPAAANTFAPETVPNVAVIDALPSGPVLVVPVETWPVPAVAVHAMLKPATALPFVSETLTTNGCARAVATTAVWALPETKSMRAAGALFTQKPATLQVGKSPGQLVVSLQGICPAPVPLQAAPKASTNPQHSVRKSLRRIGVWIIRSTQSAQAPPCEAAPGAQEPETQKANRNAETPAAARPPAKPIMLSVLFCFSESSSDFAVAPSWTEPVRSFFALDAWVYAKTPPPRAATATPAAIHAAVRRAPPPEADGDGRGASAAMAPMGAFCVSGGVAGLATAGFVVLDGVAAANAGFEDDAAPGRSGSASASSLFFAGAVFAAGASSSGRGRGGGAGMSRAGNGGAAATCLPFGSAGGAGSASAMVPPAGASRAAIFAFTRAALAGSASGSARYASYCFRASSLLPRWAYASPMPIRYSALISIR